MEDQKAAVAAPATASSKQRIMPSRKEKQDISIMEVCYVLHLVQI